ncbi:MAG: polysaccharide biosynthesis/export family protein [Lentisphaeria bacterium]|nr:polysaccharide biosynthesis/export family protein [Lentisphaeria bacterium]
MKKLFLFVSLLCALAVLTGCYNRFTGNFDQFPDINNLPSGVVDHAGLTDEDRHRQLKFLQKLDEQKEPVYRINAGDKISIRVYNHPDLIMESLVTPDGAIGVMFAGQVQVAGLTLEEASKKIKKIYGQYIKNPELGVFAIDVRSQTATIAGAVNNPGMFVISNGMRLADLFAKAGGSAVRDFDDQMLDAADFQNSIIVRDGKILPVNFSLAIEKGDRWHNVKLKKGDYIYIAVRSEVMVSIIGSINRPHKRLWDNNLGVLELVSSGLGLKEQYWKYGVIIRGGMANPRFYRVDLDGILQGRCANVRLQPGDVVYVPHDNISEYNVFIRKLLPTAQLLSTFTFPVLNLAL